DAHGDRGQVVDIGIYEAVLAMMESTIPEYALTDHVRGRTGSVLPFVAPSNIYPTSDGDYVLIAGNADTVFGRLAQATGHPEWASDERYATHHARGERQGELDEKISAWSAQRSASEVLEAMREAGVPAGKVYTAEDMMSDPQYAARENIVGVEDPEIGEVPMQNVVPRLTETPGSIAWTGPALGEHNEEIYGGLLSLNEEEMNELRERGTI
ncbi:MAG: CoA transferase, partial [Rubrobacter sp.]|nr:CoA transferase [Rubrobacter sp.]